MNRLKNFNDNKIKDKRNNKCIKDEKKEVNFKTEESQIIINNICANDINYGKIYYDINQDTIEFKNRNNDTYHLISKTRMFKQNIEKQDEQIAKKEAYMYKNFWQSHTKYCLNDIIKNPINNGLYICKLEHNESNLNPKNDKYHWDELIIQEEENQNENQTENNIELIDKLDNVYNKEIPIIYSIFLNEKCCYKYDDIKGITLRDISSCNNDEHDLVQNKCYNFKILDKYELELAFQLIIKNNLSYFDYDEETNRINILREGYYKINYSIAYHGSINYFICQMYKINKNDKDIILQSINKSINEFYIFDEFKDNKMILNGSFILPVKFNKEMINYDISFNLKFDKYNQNKEINIHPYETWLTIERLTSL